MLPIAERALLVVLPATDGAFAGAFAACAGFCAAEEACDAGVDFAAVDAGVLVAPVDGVFAAGVFAVGVLEGVFDAVDAGFDGVDAGLDGVAFFAAPAAGFFVSLSTMEIFDIPSARLH